MASNGSSSNNTGGGEEFYPIWQNCEYMQETVGVLYNISTLYVYLAFTIVLVKTCKGFNEHLKFRKNKNIQQMDVKLIVFALTIFGCVIRLIWGLGESHAFYYYYYSKIVLDRSFRSVQSIL